MAVNGSDRARWIRRGETVHVSGVALFSGMFYVGKTFGEDQTSLDRYAVNPSLPTGKSSRDYIPGHDPAGCSYEALPPSGRKAYLEWLSGSCRRTDIPVQFVNLYCGGLYIRLFHDTATDRDTVFAEARRLIVLHRENHHFVRYLGDLLSFGSVFDATQGASPMYQPEWHASLWPAATVLVRIAELVSQRRNVGADDAFLFAVERAKSRGVKPIDIDGVRLLWKRRYSGRFPDGCYVEPPTERLRLAIVMPDRVKQLKIRLPSWATRLPNPEASRSFCECVDTLYDECVKEMDGYSRLMRKTPSAAGTLQAVSVLPKQLVATSLAGKFSSVKTVLDNQLAKQGIVVSSVRRLFEFMELPFKGDEEITPSVRKMLSVAMDKMDIGFEPDSRYGALGFSFAGHIVFFRGENGMPVEWSGPYAAHGACADFVIGHMCDGGNVEAAEKALFDAARANPELTDAERVRLAARARALARNRETGKPPQFKQARLDREDMECLARLVVAVVAALPGLGVEAVSKAEKFLKKVGGDPKDIHTALHRAAPARDDLVSVVEAAPVGGRPIPARPPERKQAVPSPPAIDLARFREIEQETVLVSGLLNDIFSAEEPAVEVAVKSETPRAGSVFPGLDAGHSALLEAVMRAGVMERGLFDGLARESRLLPDGAIEVINEMGFDLFGEPVLVDNGKVIFEEHLRAELEKARVSA